MQKHPILPNNVFDKAVKFCKKETNIERPVKEHSVLIKAWEECFMTLTELSTVTTSGKFNIDKAMKLAKDNILNSPVYTKSVKNNLKMLDLLVLTRVLGMKDQYYINKNFLIKNPQGSSNGRKRRTKKTTV